MTKIEKMDYVTQERSRKKTIKYLQEKLEDLKQITNMDDFKKWHLSLMIFIGSFLSPDSTQYKNIFRNNIFEDHFPCQKIFETEQSNALTILESLIKTIEINGFPTENSKSRISVDNSTRITQTQNIDIKISELLKDELGNAKIREIEELLKKENDKDSKLKVATKALRDFGVDTLSGTLAQIILKMLGQ